MTVFGWREKMNNAVRFEGCSRKSRRKIKKESVKGFVSNLWSVVDEFFTISLPRSVFLTEQARSTL